MRKITAMTPALIAALALGLSACSSFDGSQTVRNAQSYYGLDATTTRVGDYLIVTRRGPGEPHKFVTNAVAMSRADFAVIVEKTKLPGYYQPSGSTSDNLIGSMWQKTFGFIADPSAQGMAQTPPKP